MYSCKSSALAANASTASASAASASAASTLAASALAAILLMKICKPITKSRKIKLNVKCANMKLWVFGHKIMFN